MDSQASSTKKPVILQKCRYRFGFVYIIPYQRYLSINLAGSIVIRNREILKLRMTGVSNKKISKEGRIPAQDRLIGRIRFLPGKRIIHLLRISRHALKY